MMTRSSPQKRKTEETDLTLESTIRELPLLTEERKTMEESISDDQVYNHFGLYSLCYQNGLEILKKAERSFLIIIIIKTYSIIISC
jgi:hypothetical protein